MYLVDMKGTVACPNLDVEEVLNVEGDGGAVHWGVVVQGAIVGHVGPHRERHGLGLWRHKAGR